MNKSFKYVAGLLIAGVIVINTTGCSQSPVRNPFATRQEPTLGELPAVSKETSHLAKVNWSNNILAKQDRFTKLIPTLNAQTIYAADHSGKVVALENISGKKIWSSSTGYKYIAGPTVMNNLLLLATKDAKIVALDSQTGQLVWDAKVPSEALAAPNGGNNTVLVHTIDGTISAFDSRNGEPVWQVNQATPSLTLRYSSAPVVINDKVLVGSSTGKLLALNIHNGIIEWERIISLPHGRSELQRMVDISADPIVQDDMAYVITYQGKLACVNVDSGNLIWEREISSYQNMAIDQKALYVTDNSHELWAIDRQTGSTLWKQASLAERYITGPAVIGGNVVVADRGGYMHILSADKGLILDRLHLSGKIYQNPIAMGGQFLISSHQGKLASVVLTHQQERT